MDKKYINVQIGSQGIEEYQIVVKTQTECTLYAAAELANYRANREAERQANKTKGAGIAKCANCANSKHCPSNIKNSGAGLTCGGYVPYGGR